MLHPSLRPRIALEYLAANPGLPDKTVDFTSLASNTPLHITAGSLTVPYGANLQSSCGSGIALDGSGQNTDGLIFAGYNKVAGLKIGGFGGHQLTFRNPDPAITRTVTYSCSQVRAIGPAEILPGQNFPATVVVGNSFAAAPSVYFQRWYGEPIAAATVTFTVTAGSNSAAVTFPGSQTTYQTQTDNTGLATAPTLTANTHAGDYTLTVSALLPGFAPTVRVFRLTNLPGPATYLTATSGSGQQAQVTNGFSQPLQASLTDTYGNPIPGATLTFAAPNNSAFPSGTFTNGQYTYQATTGSDGKAQAILKANTHASDYSVSVAYSNRTATYNLTNQPGPAASLTAVSGSNQSVIIGNSFSQSLRVRLLDAYSNPIPGVGIYFQAPASGASASFQGSTTQLTDSSGYASAPSLQANLTTGSYQVTAYYGNLSAGFTLTNQPAPPAAITAIAGSGQSAVVGTGYASALQAKVTDTYGNPVPGVYVTFTAPGSGPTGTFNGSLTAYALTNASGIATSPALVANGQTGNFSVTASTAGVGQTASFSLTNYIPIQAWVSDPNPVQYQPVTVYGQLYVNGQPAVGATMDTTWHYKTTTVYCTGATTGYDGIAVCTRTIGAATYGYRVVIDVAITYLGQTYITSTSFTTQ